MALMNRDYEERPTVRPSQNIYSGGGTTAPAQVNRTRPGAGGAKTGGIAGTLMKAKQMKPLEPYKPKTQIAQKIIEKRDYLQKKKNANQQQQRRMPQQQGGQLSGLGLVGAPPPPQQQMGPAVPLQRFVPQGQVTQQQPPPQQQLMRPQIQPQMGIGGQIQNAMNNFQQQLPQQQFAQPGMGGQLMNMMNNFQQQFPQQPQVQPGGIGGFIQRFQNQFPMMQQSFFNQPQNLAAYQYPQYGSFSPYQMRNPYAY